MRLVRELGYKMCSDMDWEWMGKEILTMNIILIGNCMSPRSV